LAKDDLIPFEGKVVDASRGSNYKVLLQNGVTINARLSGKIKQFKIRVIVGDKVTVSLSPYDPTHGIITHRHK
jgi:translation initiation factor IF-1